MDTDTEYFVWFRAAGIKEQIFDTNDLSTIRGSSLALLKAPDFVEKRLRSRFGDSAVRIFSGASQALFQIKADPIVLADVLEQLEKEIQGLGFEPAAVEAAVRQAKRSGSSPDVLPLGHLRFVLGFAEASGDHAEARNRTRQFRSWTIAQLPLAKKGEDADRFDLVRPATDDAYLPRDKVLSLGGDDSPNSEKLKLSASVKRRRDFGRYARQRFYWDELDDNAGRRDATQILGQFGTDLSFTDRLDDIITPLAVSSPLRVPKSLESKVAVIYADGNRFGARRNSIGPKTFSDQLREQRKSLLAAFLRWYAGGARDQQWWPAFAVKEEDNKEVQRTGLRFETLLWGGDELGFVMPSWLAFAFVKGFFAATAEWRVEKEPLTHAVGVAIAHCKTPIRQLTAIAREAADLAKDAGLQDSNSVTFEIYESLAPPDTGLAAARARVYGTSDVDDEQKKLARVLAIPGKAFPVFDKLMSALAAPNGFPRSQIYGALRKIRAIAPSGRKDQIQNLMGDEAEKAASDHLESYKRRAGGAQQVEFLMANLLPRCDWIPRER